MQIPQTPLSYQMFIDFLEQILLHLPFALRTIYFQVISMVAPLDVIFTSAPHAVFPKDTYIH